MSENDLVWDEKKNSSFIILILYSLRVLKIESDNIVTHKTIKCVLISNRLYWFILTILIFHS